jgi:hypothetical protein
MVTPVAVDYHTRIIPGSPTGAEIMHSCKRITFMGLAGKENKPGKDTTRSYYRILKGFWE